MAVKTITILGSTGSVGTQTIDLLLAAPERYHVNALIAGSNATLLAEQAKSLRPDVVVIADETAHAALCDALAGTGIRIEAGRAAVIGAAGIPTDWTMAAITGTAGLEPTLAATANGRAIALANKEALVSAGDVFLHAIAAAGATLLPVDSEHNAIFQSLADGNRAALEKIILTASGGPFRDTSVADMRDVTPERALKHPVWSMGAKISIDSATLFNKGLEVIEAARIFALAPHEIEVLVHPQSIIHGMVCYRDGSVLAQMGAPDMRIPIAHTLAWPERIATSSPRLDLAAAAKLEFFPPDPVRFPALRLAREALVAGLGASTVLNAANEVAVAAFLAKRIGFLDIAALVEAALERLGAPPIPDLDSVLALDAETRAVTESHIHGKTASRAA
jgi:1-deoxy-D-xylulose-5-phosphate reductoisomerase